MDVVASQVSTVEIRLFIGTGDKNTAAADKNVTFSSHCVHWKHFMMGHGTFGQILANKIDLKLHHIVLYFY